MAGVKRDSENGRMMMEAKMRAQRQATQTRWSAVKERGEREGVQVRQLGCGAWIATSGTDVGGAYVVTFHDCECRAALEGDPVCKHRAALRVRMGVYVVCAGECIDPMCDGHAGPGGVVICGCPGCLAPDMAQPRWLLAGTKTSQPDRTAA